VDRLVLQRSNLIVMKDFQGSSAATVFHSLGKAKYLEPADA